MGNDTQKEAPTYLGHRERLKNRYMTAGIDGLSEHEILEMILFYSIPRVDTKPLAHKLIKAFGSLSKVLSADAASLKSFGLTMNSCVLLTLFPAVNDRIYRHEWCGRKFKDYHDIGEYCTKLLFSETTEKLIMLCLDSKDVLLATNVISEGDFSSSKVDTRKIVEFAVASKCSKVVFAHNHPSGNLMPSYNDTFINSELEKMLANIDVKLLEHYIVVGNKYVGILGSESMFQRASKRSVGEEFDFDTEM